MACIGLGRAKVSNPNQRKPLSLVTPCSVDILESHPLPKLGWRM
jgi:hypothetical protein